MFPLFVVLLVAALWLYSWVRGSYWRRRGLPYEFSWPLLGSRLRFCFLQENIFDYIERMHLKYPNAIAVGLDIGSCRELVIRDPELVKHILVTDSANYVNRGLNILPVIEDQVEPLWRNLLSIDGELWRWLRKMQSPLFSLSCVKASFPLISKRAERLRHHIAAISTTPIDARELMTHYTIDFIGAFGFGTDVDSLNNKDNIMFQISSNIFKNSIGEMVGVIVKELFPKACRKIKHFARVEKEMFDFVKSIQKDRNYQPSDRKDLIDVLLSVRERQNEEKRADEKWIMDDSLMAAQAFLFFVAGFETSAISSSYTLHLLAHHPKAQERARDEVLSTLARHGGVISYEAVKEMKYLTWAFKESMRLHPPAGNIIRQVSRPCHLPDVGPLDPGIRIAVSARALHRDPQYFPNPDEFQPERFRPGNLSPDAKLAYLPFGAGPRNCIGDRLSILVSVAGLAAVLAAAYVAPAPGGPPRTHPYAFLVQTIQGGLPLIFHALEKEERTSTM